MNIQLNRRFNPVDCSLPHITKNKLFKKSISLQSKLNLVLFCYTLKKSYAALRSHKLPVMFITVPEKLFTKVVLSKGFGFSTPQDGSVCKIKVTSDEKNITSGLDESQIKEIIVGDVDEPIDRIIEDCLRTMKEKEECLIEFQHPDRVVPDDTSNKKMSNDTLVDCSNNTESSAINIDCSPNSQPQISSDVGTENMKEIDSTPDQKSDLPSHNEKGKNIHLCIHNECFIKIQFQLVSYTIEPEIWEMSVTEKWRRASCHKEKGLELYSRGMYHYAFRRFGLTLKYIISLEQDVPTGEEGMDIKGLKLSCYLNIAACQMRHHNFESVVKNASKALNLQPNNAKALYRRGAAYLELQEYENAQEDLAVAQQLEPRNQAIAKQLQILKSRVQKLNQYYASAMKKMFS